MDLEYLRLGHFLMFILMETGDGLFFSSKHNIGMCIFNQTHNWSAIILLSDAQKETAVFFVVNLDCGQAKRLVQDYVQADSCGE